MLEDAKLVAFVATAEPERSKAFYRDVLGLRLVADEPWAIVFDASGTMLRVQKVRSLPNIEHTVVGWQVADIRAVMRGLSERGIVFARYAFIEQDEDAVWTTPDGAQIAWFRDPDGNTLSLTQF